MRILSILVLSVLGVISSALGEPTPSMRWLMNEPASLFDIGMMRLREFNRIVWTPELAERVSRRGLKLTPREQRSLGNAVYNFDENTISLSAVFGGVPTEAVCSEVLEMYKDTIVLKSDPKFATLDLASFFGHINYTTARRPKDLDEQLVKLFVFTVGITDGNRPGEGNTVFCSSRLSERTPSFTKFGTMPSR